MSEKKNKGLSQEDFRKLIQTPGPQRPKNILGARSSRPKPAASRFVESESSNPHVTKNDPKKSKKSSTFTPRKIKSENVRLGYRDRAEERRQGKNVDYEDTENILDNLNNLNGELDKMESYQQSKYLGGDEKHTHLVKGLDYNLLRKNNVKIEEDSIESGDEITEDIFKLYVERHKDLELDGKNVSLGAPAFVTGLGERIYHSEFSQPSLPDKSQFEEGRKAYVFDLEIDDYATANSIPTTLLRSKIELDLKDRDFENTSKAVVQKVADLFYNLRNVSLESKKVNTHLNEPKAQIVAKKLKIDSDVCMFSDVDSDYELDIDAEIRIAKEKKAASKKG